jgi:hypothetical protein
MGRTRPARHVQAWFKSLAKSEHIHVARRGNQPGVDWATAEA